MSNQNAGTREFNRFASAPGSELPRSQFNLSHGLKTAINGAYLYPTLCMEMLPGDTFNVRENLYGRFYTMKRPVMHPIHLTTFYFAVPVRLLWDNWEKFHGYRTGPSDTDVQTDFSVPEVTVPVGGFSDESLYDYLDIKPGVEHDRVNALFARAYTFIWQEWFRDGDLIDEPTWSTGDGPDADTVHVLRKRAKRKDYLTSCRPWPQAPGSDVVIPLGDTAPVVSTGDVPTVNFTGGTNEDWLITQSVGMYAVPLPAGAETVTWGDESGLETDLSSAEAGTINQLREAFQIQRVFEREARSGRRHVEHLKAFWGVTSPDFRLQRPEFVSGDRNTIMINAVEQTAQQYAPTDPVPGDLTAHGIVASSGHGFAYSATEHMVLIGLVNLHADVAYQDGLHKKHWRGTDRFDYPLPQLMHLGEQVVEAREAYADAADQDAVFGYQERWAEYRFAESRVTGAMRSSHPTSLDVEHLALDFGAEPSLNQAFIEEDPPFDRVLLVPNGETRPALRLDMWYEIKASRIMPTYSVPGLIDHL